MYNLSDSQIDSVKTFIGKIPDSLIKSRCEKWLAEVEPTKRATAEQMENFVAFGTHLPKEVQAFPQSFAHMVKNAPETEKREATQNITETANLNDLVDESISGVADVDAPDDEEETLHTLGKEKHPKASKKTKPVSKSKKH